MEKKKKTINLLKIGAIMIDGVDISYLDEKWLRKNVLGFVSQKSDLFSGTIKENVLYGNPNASDEEMVEACKRANADEFIKSLPNGYDTQIGEMGSKMIKNKE